MSEETPQEPAVEQTPQEPTKSWVNEDGTWNRDAMGELGQHSIVEKYATAEELIKGTINKDQVLGKKIDDILSSEDESIQGRLKEIRGVPKDASGYEFNVEIPEGMEQLSESIAAYKDIFAETGIPNDAANRLIEKYVESTVSRQNEWETQMQEVYDGEKSRLESKWKNKFANNIERSANALDLLELPELAEDVRGAKTPQALKFAEAVVEKLIPLIEDDTIIEARQTQTISTIKDRMDDIDSRLAGLVSTDDGRRSPEYRKLLDEKSELIKKLA